MPARSWSIKVGKMLSRGLYPAKMPLGESNSGDPHINCESASREGFGKIKLVAFIEDV